MTKENTEKLINLLKIDRKKVIQIIKNLLKDNEKRITVPQELLEEIFIIKETRKINNKPVIVSKFDTNENVLELYKYFDFSNFKYSNLVLNATSDNTILNLMRKHNIILYPQDIYDKEATHCNFKDIIIEGKFDGWDIEGADFKGCRGNPIVNPEKLSGGFDYVNAAGVKIVGGCNDVLITGTSFENAIIDKYFFIDPQKIRYKSLAKTKLAGVTIKGSFDGVKIHKTNFKDSKVLSPINLDKIKTENNGKLEGNNFNGITFEGELSRFDLIGNLFNGSTGAVIDFEKNDNSLSKNNDLTNVIFKNIHKANNDFLFASLKNNTIIDAVVIYDAYNAENEISWYNNYSQQIPYRIPKQFINQDELLENEITDIFEDEIAIQKKKTMKSN